ncbi:MAG: ABC transporter permease [Lachnospiraceae bacterium]
MRNLQYLVRRNLDLFLNNKLNILLSAASIPIIIGLYVFFLRDFLISMVGQIGLPLGLNKEFTDRMMFAGLLVVMNTTTCFGIMQICVNDTATGIRKDFLVAPITRFSILLGYWISAILVSGFFTYATMLVGEFFFYRMYGKTLSVFTMLYLFLTGLCASGINSGILLCLAKNLKNTTTFSTFANLYGTVLGFLSGSYLPYYFYPKWLKPILFWFPPMQITSILRQWYIKEIKGRMICNSTEALMAEMLQNFGIRLQWDHKLIVLNQQWAILILSLAVLLFYLYLVCNKR